VNLAFLEFSDTDLRALQVGENADRTADAGGDSPDFRGQLNMVFRLSVREIEPYDIDPGANQCLEDLRVFGGGAESGNYFCMAGHVRSLLSFKWFARQSFGMSIEQLC